MKLKHKTTDTCIPTTTIARGIAARADRGTPAVRRDGDSPVSAGQEAQVELAVMTKPLDLASFFSLFLSSHSSKKLLEWRTSLLGWRPLLLVARSY